MGLSARGQRRACQSPTPQALCQAIKGLVPQPLVPEITASLPRRDLCTPAGASEWQSAHTCFLGLSGPYFLLEGGQALG